jgi:hypothetical protein
VESPPPPSVLDESFKEVTHPSPRHWMHHLEIHAVAQIDD